MGLRAPKNGKEWGIVGLAVVAIAAVALGIWANKPTPNPVQENSDRIQELLEESN